MSSPDLLGYGGGREVEKFSGLRIKERKLPEKRWGELMTGKKYVTLKSLSQASSSDNIVAIGVIYEKSLAKTSANGNRFAHWSLTDLAFPEPKTATLMLYGDAFEAWEGAQSSPLSTIIAVLNPVPLPDRGSSFGQEGSKRIAVKVTQSTQIVLLGICPSLGLCSSRKKDGLPCSMPCDKDRGGALVCFYHTMQQEADKVRRFQSAKNAGSGNVAAKNGLVVLQAPKLATRAAQPVKSAAARKEEAALQKFLQPTRLPASPVRVPAKSEKEKAKPPTKPPTTPSTVKPELQALAMPKHGTQPGMNEQKEPAKSFLDRKILAQFPNGIPAPDPNRPSERLKEMANARRAPPKKDRTLADALRTDQGQLKRRFGTASSNSSRAAPGDAHIVGSDGGQKRTAPSSSNDKGMALRKLEKEFGPRVALQLASGDPRKDLVRKQQAQFQGVVEEERAAKRARRLEELEVQDEAQAKMEAVTSMEVHAYRCQQCCSTFEFDRHRANCQDQGHTVTRVQVQKTRWECSNCRQSADVLDRQLPEHCSRCKGMTWKQVSLRKINRTAPMEKDLFLPRGEELPFLNSMHIPGLKAYEQSREAKDDYDGL